MAKPLLECERGYREASVDMCEYLSEGESLQVSRWLVGFAACFGFQFSFHYPDHWLVQSLNTVFFFLVLYGSFHVLLFMQWLVLNKQLKKPLQIR